MQKYLLKHIEKWLRQCATNKRIERRFIYLHSIVKKSNGWCCCWERWFSPCHFHLNTFSRQYSLPSIALRSCSIFNSIYSVAPRNNDISVLIPTLFLFFFLFVYWFVLCACVVFISIVKCRNSFFFFYFWFLGGISTLIDCEWNKLNRIGFACGFAQCELR